MTNPETSSDLVKRLEAAKVALFDGGELDWHAASAAIDDAMSEIERLTVAAPEFEGVAKTKLDSLTERGWKICGYAIEKDGEYGLVTTGAFVGWWSVAVANASAAEDRIERLTAENKRLADWFGSASVELAEAHALIERLTVERGEARRDVKIEHALFLVAAEKHSEWLENYMRMKARAEAAEALVARQAEALTLDGFADELSVALTTRGTKLRDLEAEIGVSKSATSRAARGKSVSAENFVALWNWLRARSATESST